MAKSFRLLIITPEKTVFDSEVTSVMAPGDLGYLGVLADHAPLITSLKSGNIEMTGKDGVKSKIVISGGFMEILRNTATILAESVQ